jgi:predicted glycosyltransferase
MSKRFLFYLGHPAHWHNVSRVSEILSAKGHEIMLVAREKDVLFELLDGVPYPVKYIPNTKTKSKLSLIRTVAAREFTMWNIARKFKPDLMAGTDIVIAHVGKSKGIPAIVLNEDDSKEVPFLANYGFKYASAVLSPTSCNIDPYHHKKVEYPGYHELAYLHPNYFTPDREKVKELSPDGKPYFILRFAELTAHHDDGKKGITNVLAQQVIHALEPFGRIYITSERKLETEFEKYRILVKPKDIHHALYFAEMYIGDSQTMAAEAAVLGTPSVRFNDFVGKLGYLEELEHTYQLTYGIPTDKPALLIEKIKALLATPGLDEVWKTRRTQMLEQTIDVAAFMAWFFEYYPESQRKVQDDLSFVAKNHYFNPG